MAAPKINTRYMFALWGYGIYMLMMFLFVMMMSLGMSTTARLNALHYIYMAGVVINMAALIWFPFIKNKRSVIGYITGGVALVCTTTFLSLITIYILKPDYDISKTVFYLIFAASAITLIYYIAATFLRHKSNLKIQ